MVGKVKYNMVVTATEFKTNFGKYFELVAQEDVFTTRKGSEPL